jgi:hypothetical protein
VGKENERWRDDEPFTLRLCHLLPQRGRVERLEQLERAQELLRDGHDRAKIVKLSAIVLDGNNQIGSGVCVEDSKKGKGAGVHAQNGIQSGEGRRGGKEGEEIEGRRTGAEKTVTRVRSFQNS